MKLKVCGMRESANLQDVVRQLQPDYLGFIFHPASPRFVGSSLSAEELAQLPSEIKKVGVFVNRPWKEVAETAEKWKLDVVQLHGNESPFDCLKLQNRELEVWKVFSVGSSFSFARLKEYEGRVGAFLFDTQCSGFGGSGRRFPWSILQEYKAQTPFMLSGGIDLESLKDLSLLEGLPLLGLDVNSRFEEAPGLKNVRQLLRFREALSNLKNITQ